MSSDQTFTGFHSAWTCKTQWNRRSQLGGGLYRSREHQETRPDRRRHSHCMRTSNPRLRQSSYSLSFDRTAPLHRTDSQPTRLRTCRRSRPVTAFWRHRSRYLLAMAHRFAGRNDRIESQTQCTEEYRLTAQRIGSSWSISFSFPGLKACPRPRRQAVRCRWRVPAWARARTCCVRRPWRHTSRERRPGRPRRRGGSPRR